MTLNRLKPAVPKCWLFAAGGAAWGSVGILMGATGIGWLIPAGFLVGGSCALAGLILAAVVLRRGFVRLADRNIRRLRRLPDQGCLFAFQAWRSYLLIVVMIGLGVLLRRLPIPRPALAATYLAIGGALVLGSLPYFRHLLRIQRAAARRRRTA